MNLQNLFVGLPAGVWDAFGTERFNITKNVQKQRGALSCQCLPAFSRMQCMEPARPGVDHKGSRKGQPYKEAFCSSAGAGR